MAGVRNVRFAATLFGPKHGMCDEESNCANLCLYVVTEVFLQFTRFDRVIIIPLITNLIVWQF